MTRRRLCLTLFAAMAASAQESFQAAGQHPALLLPERRLRRLRRERERRTPRWQQFETLIAGQAQMPEPGFAQALYYQVALDAGAGRRAVEWALGQQTDLRQLALVFDWCRQAMTEKQAADLAAQLERSLDRPPASSGVAEARSRVFAAIAIADCAPAASERELRRAVTEWWHGRDTLPRTDPYALLELLHVVRDNLGVNLEDSAADAFRQLALVRLLGYYPAPDGDYRLPALRGGAPGVRDAETARMADLALVAYDPNGLGSQYLQGWLMYDRFALHTPFGAPYEFLWADPYLPGLSYYHAPLMVHDAVQGLLFIRSSWEDDALWAGAFGGELQTFSNGKTAVVSLNSPKRLEFNGSVVAVPNGREPLVFDSPVERVFLVGLRPGRAYRARMERHKTREERADSGGIVEMEFPEGYRGALWLNEAH
jgi:hypothetical protein